MNFFSRLFSRKPAWHAEVLDAVKSIEADMDRMSVGAANAATECGGIIRSLLSSHPDQFRRMMDEEGLSTPDLIYAMTAKRCEDKLYSGELHVYRGVLSEQGKGYQTLFRYCLKSMVASGHMEQSFADEAEADLRAAIKEVG